MRYTALLLLILLLLINLSGIQSFHDGRTLNMKQAVFVNQAVIESEILAKPIARGGDTVRVSEAVDMKLMTYNIHRGIGKNGKLNLDATAELIASVEADIVALQEVERYSIRTGFKDQIKHLAEKLELSYAYGKSLHVLNGEYGNGLLSRYPIEEYSTYELPSMGEQRTMLRTVINIEGFRIAVYNTHLGLKQAEREEQLNYIMELIGAEELDCILMGDMNTPVDKLSKIRELMKDSAEGSEKAHYNTFEDENVKSRIDYIFLGQGIKVVGYDIIESSASDHYPVISEIVIAK